LLGKEHADSLLATYDLRFASSRVREDEGRLGGNNAQSRIDSDHDGMSDALEQALLVQFAPTFLVGRDYCSNVPAEFRPEKTRPEVMMENGTVYGQVFPARNSADAAPAAEIHYYHLWKRDCGSHGHPLDAEHVSVLVRASHSDLSSTEWKAIFWYAAAHEKTVCDVSQIARASTLHAEVHGSKVWISPGKHASFLNETLCEMRPCVNGGVERTGARRWSRFLPASSSIWERSVTR
jgi:hypothetical protein